jgi:hypothetical protein
MQVTCWRLEIRRERQIVERPATRWEKYCASESGAASARGPRLRTDTPGSRQACPDTAIRVGRPHLTVVRRDCRAAGGSTASSSVSQPALRAWLLCPRHRQSQPRFGPECTARGPRSALAYPVNRRCLEDPPWIAGELFSHTRRVVGSRRCRSWCDAVAQGGRGPALSVRGGRGSVAHLCTDRGLAPCRFGACRSRLLCFLPRARRPPLPHACRWTHGQGRRACGWGVRRRIAELS